MKSTKVNKEHLQKFYAEAALPKLREMLNSVSLIPFPHAGVCPNILWDVRHELPAHVDHFKHLIRDLAKSWEHYSGNEMYPISSGSEYITARDYYIDGNLWSGRQLEMRCKFMLHLIKGIQETQL